MEVLRKRAIPITALVLVLVAALFVIVARVLSTPPAERAQRAYERGQWSAVVAATTDLLALHPGDESALRWQARALAQLGRPEVLTLDAQLGGDRLEAEDLYLAGRTLLQAQQTTLGWAALAAATQLDANHPGATELLAGRGRAGAGSTGSMSLDRLQAVPNGAALAELVVGLATLGKASPGGEEGNRLLHSVLRRDRSQLRKVDSPLAARRLLARVLLEEGRASAARERLGSADGPESAWLLSRALLVEGDGPRAAAAARRAGSFGADQPLSPEPSRYRGARECAECHREIYDAQQASNHAATIAWGAGLRDIPLPAGPVVDPVNPAVTHRFERQGSSLSVAAEVDHTTVRAVIDYALGSGQHGMTMLAREPTGEHRSLRLSYYSGGTYWGLTSEFGPQPANPHGYIGEMLNEASFRNCLNCHTTRFVGESDRQGAEVADRGIGCERCHGPGDHHIRAVESGFPQLAIARPKLATPAQRLKLCGQCHSSDGVIPPADPRFIRFQATTLPYSRCVSESGGKLDCVACHDPHRNVETSPAYYEARCLACHGESRPIPPDVRVEAVAAARCSVNATSGCVGCHMPKVDNIMPFMSFTDHQIRVHPATPAPGSPGSRP